MRNLEAKFYICMILVGQECKKLSFFGREEYRLSADDYLFNVTAKDFGL